MSKLQFDLLAANDKKDKKIYSNKDMERERRENMEKNPVLWICTGGGNRDVDGIYLL